MSEGKLKKKLKTLFFFRVRTLFVMSEDSLTIEYNEHALSNVAKVSEHTVNLKGALLIEGA